jgi:hypothetical protein
MIDSKYYSKVNGIITIVKNMASPGKFDYLDSPNSLTMKYIPSNPANNTPLSSETERRCSLANSASNGFPSAVASIEPICTRNAAILGLTACCDTTVRPIISATHNTTGLSNAGNERTRPTRATSSTTPHTTPIMCIHHSPYPTMAPAWSRLAKIRNAPGATTKLKNTSLPNHKLNARNSTVRKNVLIASSLTQPRAQLRKI